MHKYTTFRPDIQHIISGIVKSLFLQIQIVDKDIIIRVIFKLPTMEENDVDYYKGVAYRGLGDKENVGFFFVKATRGSSEPVQAFFYNDAQPDKFSTRA